MPPLLTIGLPVYNSMPYLRETFESLLAQTVSDFKILAVADDCSDGSLEYLESIRDPRLRIIRRPRGGLASALNRMLRETETPWLVRQDTDDISYPNRVERVLDSINSFPDAGMFYSLADYYPKDQCLGQFRCSRGSPAELRKLVKSGYLLSFCHPSVVLNKEKTVAVGGYRENVHVEDADLWWRMALAHDIRLIPLALVGYRQNSSSLVTRYFTRGHVEGLYIQYCLLSHLWSLPAHPLEQVKQRLESFVQMKDLKAKEHLRNVNMLLAAGRYSSAAAEALRCCTTSPMFLLRRALDEVHLSGMICNGVNPRLYLQHKHEFWPSSAASDPHLGRSSRICPQCD
jgi:glycosyltransferase involved in cell wall biosynthesis